MLWVTSVVIRPPLASPSKEYWANFYQNYYPGGGGIGADGEVIKFTTSCVLIGTDATFQIWSKLVPLGKMLMYDARREFPTQSKIKLSHLPVGQYSLREDLISWYMYFGVYRIKS